jgi:glycosyltransferase involved in cell wall biosynthesis
MKVGIKYSYNENWIGGTYYVENLLRALDGSNDAKKMEMFIFSDKASFDRVSKITSHILLKQGNLFPEYSLIERSLNKVLRGFIGRNLINKSTDIDLVFPLNGRDKYFNKVERKIYWIPDFQDKFLGGFFSPEELKVRADSYDYISSNAEELVFSSNAALNDFKVLFPASKANTYVLQFAVSHDFTALPAFEDVLQKYQLDSVYFMSPNQFWQHKNHSIILEAASILKKQGFNAQFVFTGKEYDYRNPDYTDQIKNLAKELGIEDSVKFLGFIDRNDQIALMKNAQAIIQPSFFEGWSTVVEDAKALNQTIIASDIAVHREQLGDAGNYFDPKSAEALSKLLRRSLDGEHLNQYTADYNTSILNFANDFLSIVQSRK